MTTQYVRIVPYNKKEGALAARVCVGGKLFISGKWYRMPAEQAAKLLPLRQSTGAPYFQVLDAERFEETSRRELAAAMTAAGLDGLAMQGAQEAPRPAPPPSAGPRKGAFDGLEKSVSDVDLSQPQAREREEEPPLPDEPDIDRMTKAELLVLADQRGVKVPSGTSSARIRALLRDSD